MKIVTISVNWIWDRLVTYWHALLERSKANLRSSSEQFFLSFYWRCWGLCHKIYQLGKVLGMILFVTGSGVSNKLFSPQCFIPSLLSVPISWFRRRFLYSFFFTIYWHGGYLAQRTRTFWINNHLPDSIRLHYDIWLQMTMPLQRMLLQNALLWKPFFYM